MSFPEIGLADALTHALEIENKKTDEFSRPGKLKFRKKFWMSFPGF